jgi:hypothetical protein
MNFAEPEISDALGWPARFTLQPFFSWETKDRRDFGVKDFSTMSMKARFQSQRRLKSLSKLAEMLDKVHG